MPLETVEHGDEIVGCRIDRNITIDARRRTSKHLAFDLTHADGDDANPSVQLSQPVHDL